MIVEVLFFADCPNYLPALRNVREALQQEGMAADIRHVEVLDRNMAEAIGFLGSPTIRIDGIDVEPAARASTGFGLCCRTYTAGRTAGTPPVDLIRRALCERRGHCAEQDCCQ